MKTARKSKLRKLTNRPLATATDSCSVLRMDLADQDRLCPIMPVLRDMPVGIIISDPRGKFTLFNPEAERILGMGPEQVGETQWSQVYGCYKPDRVTPYPSEQLPLARALRGEEVRDELIFIRNSVQTRGIWIRVSASPLVNAPLEPGSAVVVLRDVTEHRRAIESVELLSRAVEQTADSVVVTDKDGVIEYVNSAFELTTGFTREEALGNTPRILRSGQHSLSFYNELWAQILQGQPFRGTLINRKKNGELYWAEQTITPIKDYAGNISHFVSVLKDVTQSRRQQEHEIQLRLARHVQQRFYSAPMHWPGLDIGHAVYPAAETGGDYIDFIPRTATRVDVVVGDVSGHGLDSALVMTLTRAYLRAFSAQLKATSDVLEAVNRELLSDLQDSRYVTLLLASIDVARGTLSYSSAGHVPGFLLDPSGHFDSSIESTGMPLGLFENCDVRTVTVPLRSGNIIVLPTDGVAEASNPDGEEFSTERVLEYLCTHHSETAQHIADGLCRAARAFAGEAGQQDDLTAVILKVA